MLDVFTLDDVLHIGWFSGLADDIDKWWMFNFGVPLFCINYRSFEKYKDSFWKQNCITVPIYHISIAFTKSGIITRTQWFQ